MKLTILPLLALAPLASAAFQPDVVVDAGLSASLAEPAAPLGTPAH